MKISLNWLRDFVDITEKNPEKIKQVITANTAKIETMEDLAESMGNVVVGEVKHFEKHPNADTLHVAKVDVGKKEPIQLIFGQMVTMHIGDRVPVAIAPTRLLSGAVIERSKIRGVTSEGMLCLDQELGLKAEGVSIMYFPKEKPGTPVSKLLGLDDTVIDIDNHALTNRGDLFSHVGFAREFVANGLAKWKKRKPFKMPANNSEIPLKFTIDPKVCSHYMGVYITGVEVGESPEWLKKRLTAVGIRPLGNLIDITNYVMMEIGIPTHAYDLDQVKGRHWTIRHGKAGEKVITLDQKSLPVSPEVMVIDDGTELIDLCGIMGGYRSGVKPGTNRVWLHVPVYSPVGIRRSSKATGQVTEAGVMYEKGIDNEKAYLGLERCVELILELCPNAKVASKVLDVKNYKPETHKLKLRNDHIQRLVGCKVPAKTAEKALTDLGFELKKEKEGCTVTIPSWRLADVYAEADLIEEVARVHGYDNIPVTNPIIEATPPPLKPRRRLERETRESLAGLGYDEIYTFSFVSPELLKKCAAKPDAETIEVANPISADISLMRQSLLPRMLETIAGNLRYHSEFRLFELSKTYHKIHGKPVEKSTLIAAAVGKDFRKLQGAMEYLGLKVMPAKAEGFLEHPGRVARLAAQGQDVGRLFEVHPQILKNFDIKTRVTVAEVDMQVIHEKTKRSRPKYQELPRFPAVVLDVSIAIPERELAEKYFGVIGKTDKTLITQVDLIDEYAGDKMEKGKRSLTYSITYQSPDRTLTDEEVGAIHQKVITNLKSNGAIIR